MEFMTRLVAIIAVSVCASCIATAQSDAPQFEVASVKSSNSGPQGVWNEGSHERVRRLNMTLRSIVAQAYGIKDHDVFGPAWIDSERFEIIAKISPETANLPERARWKQIGAMTQALLADRFKLEVHRETREMPVYVLIPAKGGVKLGETGAPSNDWVRAQLGPGSLVAKQMPTAQLLSILGGIVHREVLDQSGIKGVFDIALKWAPDDVAANPATGGAAVKPSIFTALQEQAGLKLESRKVPMEVVVVDHAERPSGN
jgi:uncharacterized protein (TIGR03435 family)